MEKQVMYDSPEAATYKTVTGWVSRNGHFYGDNEHVARWAGSTHKKCECGNIFEKGYTKCRSCRAKDSTERYYALPMVEWDGNTPVCTWRDDQFFFDKGSVLDWMDDLKHDAGMEDVEVQLVLCKPGKLGYVGEDNWADDLPEDGELPTEVAKKVDELNEAIKNAPVVSWWPGKTRINVDALWGQLKKDEVSE